MYEQRINRHIWARGWDVPQLAVIHYGHENRIVPAHRQVLEEVILRELRDRGQVRLRRLTMLRHRVLRHRTLKSAARRRAPVQITSASGSRKHSAEKRRGRNTPPK